MEIEKRIPLGLSVASIQWPKDSKEEKETISLRFMT